MKLSTLAHSFSQSTTETTTILKLCMEFVSAITQWNLAVWNKHIWNSSMLSNTFVLPWTPLF